VARQAFSAGVGNWVADEVLYQARIHPEQKANSLGAEQAAALHAQLQGVLQVEQPPGAGRPAGQPAGSPGGSVAGALACMSRPWATVRASAVSWLFYLTAETSPAGASGRPQGLC